MKLSNIMKVQDQAARTLIYILQMEVMKLKEEIAELKRNQPQKAYIGFRVGPNATILEMAFPSIKNGGESA